MTIIQAESRINDGGWNATRRTCLAFKGYDHRPHMMNVLDLFQGGKIAVKEVGR